MLLKAFKARVEFLVLYVSGIVL